jgi:hypothetical protein
MQLTNNRKKMVKNSTLLILFILIGNTAISQIVHFHTHLNNTDRETQQKLNLLISTIAQRNVALATINRNLSVTLEKHKAQMQKKYSSNRYDKEDNFLTSSLSSISLSLATSILATYSKMPYMPQTKKDYLNAVTMDKSILLALQYIDAKTVSSGDRQEIYRLRTQLIREFSKNDRDARELLMFSAVAMGITNYKDFLELKTKLDAIQITF